MGAGHGRNASFAGCPSCSGIDASEWLCCLAEDRDGAMPGEFPALLRVCPSQEALVPRSESSQAGPACPGSPMGWRTSEGSSLHEASPTGSRRRRAKDTSSMLWNDVAGAERLEELTRELFRLHDLNNDGVLEEIELIKLNQKIAMLHHGLDTDTSEVRSKYRSLFRDKLDPNGDPVPYETFRAYAREVLQGLDPDPEAQEMILEQFVAEAQTGRQAINLEALLTERDIALKESDIPVMLNKVIEEMERSKATQGRIDAFEWRFEEMGTVVAGIPVAGPGDEAPAREATGAIEVSSEWRYLDSPAASGCKDRRIDTAPRATVLGKASLARCPGL